jgi:L-asparaginase
MLVPANVEAEDHVVANVAGEKLRGAIQDIPAGIDIRVDDFMNIVSCAMTLPVAFSLAQRINLHLAEDDRIGVVVTHGTDTMEEAPT